MSVSGSVYRTHRKSVTIIASTDCHRFGSTVGTKLRVHRSIAHHATVRTHRCVRTGDQRKTCYVTPENSAAGVQIQHSIRYVPDMA
eukprot:3941926-Rhodomonas_salina.1